MRIVLISYGGYEAPGVIHMHHFANELVVQGHQVIFLVHGDVAGAAAMSDTPVYTLEQVRFERESLTRSLLQQMKRFSPNIVHAWTPRNVTARAGMEIALATGARLIIHYEDDEEAIYEQYVGDLFRDPVWYASTIKQPESYGFFHPVYSPAACHLATGFTAISDLLIPRLEQYWVKPAYLLYPGVDLQRFSPGLKPDERLIDSLDLRDKIVIMYSGALSELHDFHLLIEALAGLLPEFPNLILVHIGRVFTAQALDKMIDRLRIREHVRFVGPVMHKDVPQYLALADILVQTGKPNMFNESRLPSKLPEYMAMGKPIITFSVGFGRLLRDGVEVLKTYTDRAEELQEGIQRILTDSQLRTRLGANARAKAEQLFNWRANTAGLLRFYAQMCATHVPYLDTSQRDISHRRFAHSAVLLDQVCINIAVIGSSPRAQRLVSALSSATQTWTLNSATFVVDAYESLPTSFNLDHRPNLIVFADGVLPPIDASRFVARIFVWPCNAELPIVEPATCFDFALPVIGDSQPLDQVVQRLIDASWAPKPLRAQTPQPTVPELWDVTSDEAVVQVPHPAQHYRNKLSYILTQIANNYEHGGMKLVAQYGTRYLLGRR